MHWIARFIVGQFNRFNPINIRHKRKAVQFYSRFIKKGDLCFDVGANFGKKTEIFLELGAKVICIEPQQVCLRYLYKKLKENKNVRIVAKGVADRDGSAGLSICEDWPGISTMSDKWQSKGRYSKKYKWTKSQEISVTTLNTLIAQYGLPVFCKIDVEGLEKSVLKGLTQPIPFISFEFTREFFNDAKDCIKHLLSIGQFEFNCSIGESTEFLFPSWVTPTQLYEKLDLLKDKLLCGDIYAKNLATKAQRN